MSPLNYRLWSWSFFVMFSSFLCLPLQDPNVSEDVFDYIIVGGGTAGLALASRLSEEPGNRVLVLE
ncbi:hypothetical protein CROQUDRAFT_665752, partial [Cronartium quercuum f. sp. fusiforme G11]